MAKKGHNVRVMKSRGDRELIMKLALALKGTGGVHDFDGDGEAGGEDGLVDGAEAAVAEAVGGGKRRRSAAEEGVGESAGEFVGIFLVGF